MYGVHLLNETATMKIKELLKLNVTVDVGNDYSDEFTDDCGTEGFIAEIAFVGPQELTDEGKEHFARALDFDVDVGSDYATVHIPKGDDEQMEKDLTLVMMMFYGASGNAPCSFCDKFFKGF